MEVFCEFILQQYCIDIIYSLSELDVKILDWERNVPAFSAGEVKWKYKVLASCSRPAVVKLFTRNSAFGGMKGNVLSDTCKSYSPLKMEMK